MSAPARAYDTPWTRGNTAIKRTARRARPPRPVSRRPPRPRLRLVPPRPVRAPRTPFVVLVLALLAGGLVALLLLNAAGVANSDRQRMLRKDMAELQIREQQLTREVSTMEAPGALAAAARRLGMVPGGESAFLVLLPDGSARVVGTPSVATVPPPPPSPPPSTTASPDPTRSQQPTGGQPGQEPQNGAGR